MSVNKAIVIGHLGQDPDVKFTNSGMPVCRLSVATTRTWTNKQTDERQSETEWHRITVWGKQAEHCGEYLAKGRQVYVEGYLRTSSYDDEEGKKRYSTEIVAEKVQFLGGKPQDEGEDRGQRQSSQVQASQGKGQKPQKGQAQTSKNQQQQGYDEDDDIPF